MSPPLSITEPQALTACGCASFAASLAARSPYADVDALIETARAVWWEEVRRRETQERQRVFFLSSSLPANLNHSLPPVHQIPITGWLEAFASHPVLGDTAKLAAAPETAHTRLSVGEQAATTADAAGAAALAEANAAYAARFGHTFIACAAGRGAGELKEDLEARMANPPYAELAVAAAEQMKITERRLRGLVEAAAPPGPAPAAAAPPLGRSPLTTNVLDTSAGRPAAGGWAGGRAGKCASGRAGGRAAGGQAGGRAGNTSIHIYAYLYM